jgi:pyridoxal phosphate phosphatase PHOSPHO2
MHTYAFVWDFDWSLLDGANSDFFVYEQLGQSELSRRLSEQSRAPENAGRFTALVDWGLGELAARGVCRAELETALRQAPMSPSSIEAVKCIDANGAKQHIVSDANAVFIAEILRARGIEGLFASVHTNGAAWEGERLRVTPHQALATSTSGPHGCQLCPPNLCKGNVIDSIPLGGTRIAYVGDGSGDLCAALRLGSDDVVLARTGYPLLHAITAEEQGKCRARVIPWHDADALLACVRDLLGAESKGT